MKYQIVRESNGKLIDVESLSTGEGFPSGDVLLKAVDESENGADFIRLLAFTIGKGDDEDRQTQIKSLSLGGSSNYSILLYSAYHYLCQFIRRCDYIATNDIIILQEFAEIIRQKGTEYHKKYLYATTQQIPDFIVKLMNKLKEKKEKMEKFPTLEN